jgi:hypothetical protein
MALTTYAGLQASIADYLNRGDLTAQIPDFITLAEADLNGSVRHWRAVKRATATLNAQFLTLPVDWVEGRNIQLSTDPLTPLQFASIQQLDELRARHPGPGHPMWYAIHGTYLEFAPAPDGEYTVEMTYYKRLESMSDDTDTNWLLTYYPQAYLYGALLQAALFLRDDERLGQWKGLYEDAVTTINRDSDLAATSAATPLARSKRVFG